ncbi:hypothetical protein COB57_02700 [Candidatus Peregrinibacteria bacterium]|nr:MAG: hypothetical protein COB57_02700 [Candidatus Peregrinibacteria bacterium]
MFDNLIFGRHLDEEETIRYVAHKHYIEVVPDIVKLGFFGILCPWLIALTLTVPAMLWMAGIFSFIIYIRMMYIIFDWYFDAILITSHSLIFVMWHGFFHKESTRVSYESVESIGLEQRGVAAISLGFGEVQIEREAAPEIAFFPARSPKRIEREILRGKEVYEDRNMSENSDALHGVLSEIMAAHIKKHGWKKRGY